MDSTDKEKCVQYIWMPDGNDKIILEYMLLLIKISIKWKSERVLPSDEDAVGNLVKECTTKPLFNFEVLA